MLQPVAITVLASAAQTASGQGAGLDLGTSGYDTVRLHLDITAVSGASAAVVVTLQTSADNASWRTVKAWASQTAIGRTRLIFQPVDRYVRVTYAITGTLPSVTFSVTGEKCRALATIAELKTFHNASQFGTVTDEILEKWLWAASLEACGELSKRFGMPLVSWGDDIREKVCDLAVWSIISKNRGFNPEAGGDIAVRTNKVDAMKWFERVGTNDVHPQTVVDSTPTEDESEAYIVSDAPRWR